MPAARPARRRCAGVAAAALALALLATACSSRAVEESPAAAALPAGSSSSASPSTKASAVVSPAVVPVAHAPVSRTAPTPVSSTATPPGPCAHNSAARLVLVGVRAQHVWMCARHAVVFDSAVTTGAVDLPYDSTPTGTFRVQEKDRDRVLTLVSGEQYTVKYWIPFDAPLFGFHDSPWQTMPYGSQKYRTKGSHGCVHMPLPAMRFLYKWAEVGTRVRIKP